MRFGISLAAAALFAPAAVAQLDFGDGADGPLTVAGTTTLDVLTGIAAPATGGATVVTVDSPAGIGPGDEILIHTTLDSGGGAGAFEFAEVLSVAAANITLTAPLSGDYPINSTLRHQVVRVGNYTDVLVQNGGTLECAAVNNTFGFPAGGVLALRANGSVTVEAGGTITAASRGYLGGDFGQTAVSTFDAEQGDSGIAIGTIDSAANGSGGGGGGSNGATGSGGGGGGHATAGGSGVSAGGSVGQGGGTHGDSAFTVLTFGAGGGGGGRGSLGNSGVGGDGGGLVFIAAPTITIDGTVTAIGGNGDAPGGAGGGTGAAGGGGAAGGSVLLQGDTVAVAGAVSAVGGAGGPGGPSNISALGGDGGDGRIRVEYITSYDETGTVTPTPSTEALGPTTGVQHHIIYR